MKVILSRKGFDSSSGGYPSPVFPDGTMLSMPIPAFGAEVGIEYSKLTLPSCVRSQECKSYLDLMRKLYLKEVTKENIRTKEPMLFYNKEWRVFNETTQCHLDPDLCFETTNRGDLCKNNWKPMFGQVDESQSHLSNKVIGKGDLFLFYGLFQKINKSCKFIGEPFHCIWGYLKVGEVIKAEQCYTIAQKHPHARHDFPVRIKNSNAIYTIGEYQNTSEVAGVFNYSDNLKLTKDGLSPSRWELPDSFKSLEISYHPKNHKSLGFQTKDGNEFFQSAYRGQEFAIQKHKDDKGTENEMQLSKWSSENIFGKSTLRYC